MTITLNALQQQRRDTASNWTSNNTVLLAGEWGIETDTKKFKIGDGTTAWQSLDYVPIPDVNRLLTGDLTIAGSLTVNGTTTTIDTTTLTVEDINIEIGKVSSPSDTTADGGGITLKGATDKTINWVDSTDSWTFSEHLDLASGKVLKSAGTQFLSSTQYTGNSATATALATARTIGGVSFDGTANIDLPGVNSAGNQNTTGSAATLTTPRTIAGVSFDGSANISLNNNAITNGAGYIDGSSLNASNLSSGTVPDSRLPTTLPAISGSNLTSLNANNLASGTVPDARLPSSISSDITGNAATATALATARTISGVSFDGTANITLNNSNITNGAGYITATLTNEEVQDIVGNMLSGNTETGITVTYQDSDGTIDFVVASQTDENFTTTLKNKLDGITAGATAVTNNNQISNGANYIAATGGTFTGDVTFDGATAGTDVMFDRSDNKFHFADNAKAVFGESSDLEIYHNGSNSYIKENGTGNLYIFSANLRIENSDGSESYIEGNDGGAVELYYDGSKKLSTESYGVSLHGLTQSTQSYVLYYNSSTGQVTYAASSGGGISSLVEDTTPQLGGDLDTNSFEILLDDNHAVKFGDSADLTLLHSGSTGVLNCITGDLHLKTTSSGDDIVLISNDDIELQVQGGEDGIKVIGDGAVELYYDNSKKLETVSYGVVIKGTAEIQSGAMVVFDSSDVGVTNSASFGNSADLKIFHDGTDTHFKTTHTTGQVIHSAKEWRLQNLANNENMILANQDAMARLFYDGSTKFETSAGGVNVTGELNVTTKVAYPDNAKAIFGTGDDLQIYHDGSDNFLTTSNGYLKIKVDGSNLYLDSNETRIRSSDGNENQAKFIDDGAVELYYDNSKKLETYGSGVYITGRLKQAGSNADFLIEAVGPGGHVKFVTTGADRWYVEGTHGHFLPTANNTYDIGSTSYRVRNIYTNDLNLSNEGSSNDVDATWGSYTIQEGAEDLFLINRRNGKKYKFDLTEVL